MNDKMLKAIWVSKFFFGRWKNATGVIDVIDRGEVTRSNLSAELGRRMKTAFHH